MIYLLSSQPKTIETYLQSKQLAYTLITKETFKEFAQNYIAQPDDIGIVYDFGKIVPDSLLQKLLLLNIHFSLLPKYRGAIPVEAAIRDGEKVTGISIQKMVKAMDEGPLLLMKEVKIDECWTAGELQAHMDSLLPDLLEKLELGQKKTYTFYSQEGAPSYCYIKELDREIAKIDWKNGTSFEMVNKVRAYNPEPLAWLLVEKSGQKKVVNILRAEQIHDITLEQGNFLFIKKRGLALGTKDGVALITELVVEGSKVLKGGDIVALKGLTVL